MQSAARDHISRARELETKDQLDGALIEYRRRSRWTRRTASPSRRAAELERTIRDRIEKSRPKPPIDALRQQARAAVQQPLLNPANREPLRITFNNSSLRDILNARRAERDQRQFDRQYFTDTPVTVRLDGVTLEQALQQVLSANGHFYKVLNQNTIIVAQDNAQAHAQVRRAGRPRVLPLARGRDRDRADHQHGHAHPDCRCSRRSSRTRRRTRSPSAATARWWTSSSGSSAPTTSRAPKSSSTCRSSRSIASGPSSSAST